MDRRWSALAHLLLLSVIAAGCSQGGTEELTIDPAVGPLPEAVLTGDPILFVTQVPIPADFATVAAAFGNHLPDPAACGRGGDLWIRYPQGRLKNLTRDAGYGKSGFQGGSSIAVREPCVHWNGQKAVFSMVVGAPAQFLPTTSRWQLYEVTGLDADDTPVITKVPGQPTAFNNTAPCYASDGRILFTSDRPRNGALHLYPQLDEYEEQPTNTGLWSLNPATAALFQLNHAPSGVFSPRVDSFGRVIFTRWDHMQRDQQADDDEIAGGTLGIFGTFNYSSEAANSVPTLNNSEVFPEPRSHWISFINDHPGYAGDLRGYASHLTGHDFSHFFPWQIHQDGTAEETLNHVGRHELQEYVPLSRNDDPNVVSQLAFSPFTANPHALRNVFQMREDPNDPGTYWAIDAPEFFTHAAGQVIKLHGPPGLSPDAMTVNPITHPETSDFTDEPTPEHSGLYRSPLPLPNGRVVVVHTSETNKDANEGTSAAPRSRYDFRLKVLELDGRYSRAGRTLTEGIRKSVEYYNVGELVSYSGELWELDPVAVVARPVPPAPTAPLESAEALVLAEENVSYASLVAYLKSRDLALVVSRNVTTRDRNDEQQPFNLRVSGTQLQTIGAPGTIYDVKYMQFFQADQLRGLTFGQQTIAPGRRVIAQTMHGSTLQNPPVPGAPDGSVKIATDGSMAALVPARRAMSWQLTNPTGGGVVRERYWLTFQPGEVRTCVSCHGLSSADQAGHSAPVNKPQALRQLLQYLKSVGSL
jgi:hypothetical protein